MKSLPTGPDRPATQAQWLAATAQSVPEEAQALARARAFAEPLIASETLDTGENILAHADAMVDILRGIGGSEAMQAASYLIYACEHLNRPQEVIAKAKTPEERLRRIADLLAKWPGDMRLRLMRMDIEEELGRPEAARRTAEEVRRDPYADAQARTAVGELFVRLGDEAAARRAFSEIVEFAPREPLARRRLGDLYRAHGWYDEAYRQYQTLLLLQPGDQSALLLLAMAAAGAGHIEEALGLEQRVIGTAEPGSENGLSKIALLSTSLRLAELREAARKSSDAEGLARLVLRARQSGAVPAASE